MNWLLGRGWRWVLMTCSREKANTHRSTTSIRGGDVAGTVKEAELFLGGALSFVAAAEFSGWQYFNDKSIFHCSNVGNPWSDLGKVSVPTLLTAQVKKLLAIAAFRAFKTLLLQKSEKICFKQTENKDKRQNSLTSIPQVDSLIRPVVAHGVNTISAPFSPETAELKMSSNEYFCKEKRKIGRTVKYLRTFWTLSSVHHPVLRVFPAITDIHSKIPKDCAEHSVACIALQYVP